MKGLIQILWLPYQCFCLYSLLVYAMIFWTLSDGWMAGFLMMSFPVVLIIHLISIPVWFVISKKKAVLPVVMSLLAMPFMPRTYALNSEAAPLPAETFKVMNYNTLSFKVNSNQKDENVLGGIEGMKNWVAGSDADIICMPEYYDDITKRFNTRETLTKRGFRYHRFFEKSKMRTESRYWGLAVFSRFPIVASRDTVFTDQNGMISTDIKIGRDTLRVVAVHLYSMTLNLTRLARQREMDGVVHEGRFTLGKMKNGFTQRAEQLKSLERWTSNSPYPVILCGDFNEVPYGFVYGKLRENLKNAFEEKGRGFGFSYNQLPYFIRIDHQFYDAKKLDLHRFRTLREVDFSDHYPVEGIYSFVP